MSAARAILRRLGLLPLAWRAEEIRRAFSVSPGPAADEAGVAIPGRWLRTRVVARGDHEYFLAAGREAVAFLDALLRAEGASFAAAGRVLDFGCGCGRLARHLPALTRAAIEGRDQDRALVAWCAANLAGTYRRNGRLPPLDLADGAVDVVYALSVFTHMRAPAQEAWADELARVLAPGGVALVTFHDERQPGVDPAFLARVAGEGEVVRTDAGEFSNLLAAYRSGANAKAFFGRRLEVRRIVASDEAPFRQAVAVLRKPG